MRPATRMTDTGSVREFYDQLAVDYHLIYPDWRGAVRRQGAVLDRLVRTLLGDGPFSILDCACGIGTQAIGLALRGHHVHATDLSAASVERARTEAASFGADITFGLADFRDLAASIDQTFDVVIACDNSLPHAVSDEELGRAAREVAARLRPGGLFVASIRDYDALAASRPPTTDPESFDGPDGRRLVIQAWDWATDGRTYTIDLFIVRETPDGWAMTHHATTYRALLRAELTEILIAAGFSRVRWHAPDETGYYQPIVTARTSRL